MKEALIATAWNDDKIVMKGIKPHFEIIFDYLSFRNMGMVLAKGAGTVGMMPESYYEEAYQLGKSILERSRMIVMKRIVIALLMAVMVISLIACVCRRQRILSGMG